MKGLCFKDTEKLEIITVPIPKIENDLDVIVKMTYASICSSDIHIVKGKVPRSKKGIILGHEGIGIVTEIGKCVKKIKKGDRVSINCITFCGECYFCKNGYINNCSIGGWEIGCRINGTLAEYVRIPYGDCSLNVIPSEVDDKDVVLVGDALSSGYFGMELANAKKGDIIVVIGCGPVGLCTLKCGKMIGCKLIALDINDKCLEFAKKLDLADYYFNPSILSESSLISKIQEICKEKKGADATIEVAGSSNSFSLSWKLARPNGTVAIVAMYEESQNLPLHEMYGKNLTFKTGGVDAIHCDFLIEKIKKQEIKCRDLITHELMFDKVIEAFEMFREKKEGCVKIGIKF